MKPEIVTIACAADARHVLAAVAPAARDGFDVDANQIDAMRVKHPEHAALLDTLDVDRIDDLALLVRALELGLYVYFRLGPAPAVPPIFDRNEAWLALGAIGELTLRTAVENESAVRALLPPSAAR